MKLPKLYNTPTSYQSSVTVFRRNVFVAHEYIERVKVGGTRLKLSHVTRYVLRITLLLSISLGLLFNLSPTLVFAQNPDAEVDFFLVPSEEAKPFTIGDHIVLRLEVTHPVDSRVDFPQLVNGEPWGSLELVDQTEPQTTRNSDGTATTGRDIIVTAYEPGQYQTESLVVTHHRADDSNEELGTPVIPFNIDTVLIEGDTDLRDLKAQVDLPVPPVWPWILAGLLAVFLLIGALVAGGLWLHHRRKKLQSQLPIPLTPAFDPRPPEVVAFAELDRIEALNLPAKSQFKEHYSLVTNCLRRYIEGRYHIPALERTTDELRDSFAKSSAPAKDRQGFLRLFTNSDFVKFARVRPSSHDAFLLVDEARTLVDVTTPQPEPANQLTETEAEPEVVA